MDVLNSQTFILFMKTKTPFMIRSKIHQFLANEMVRKKSHFFIRSWEHSVSNWLRVYVTCLDMYGKTIKNEKLNKQFSVLTKPSDILKLKSCTLHQGAPPTLFVVSRPFFMLLCQIYEKIITCTFLQSQSGLSSNCHDMKLLFSKFHI